jgi:crotonobetainyl-CoA:carnitine CoA-transferase CaiB-like acyl-CoA transferase
VHQQGDRHWPPLARAVGHPEWTSDPRFATPRDRAVHAGTLIGLLDEIFATKTREEWSAIFATEPELWWSPVQSLDEVIADPQVHAAGGLCEVPDDGSTTLLPATPVDFHGTPWKPRWMAPSHGQHTDEVLRELGRSDAQLSELRAKGVVV